MLFTFHMDEFNYSIYTYTFCKYMYCVFEIHMICCTVRICTCLWMSFNLMVLVTGVLLTTGIVLSDKSICC